ncbi:MAG: tape measure protein [Azoarcus sp.]|jgi:tape measure domain-containing protein|nr:tape measure protein [Azoarcus sp.]
MAAGELALALKIRADLKQAYDELGRLTSGLGAVDGAVGKTRRGLESISTQLERSGALVKQFTAAWIGLSQVKSLISMVDQYGQMASRIKMATVGAEEYEAVQQRLLTTANNTYRPLAEAQEMYIRTADALKSMGYNTEQVLDVTDSLSYLLVTNAASGERGASAIDAFSKSLQKGEVNALQWQTILVAVPTLVDKIAEATGKTGEAIRRMGAEGELALTDLTEGLRRSLAQNLADAEKMPTTVADAFTRLRTNIQAYLGQANEGVVSTQALADAIKTLATHVDQLVPAVITFVGLMGGRYLITMAAATAAKVKDAAAARQQAVAALAAAKAAVDAATATNTATMGMGNSAAALAATQARLVTAQTALKASTLSLATTGRMLLAFLGGPLGLAMTAAASAFLLFGDNAKQAENSLADLNIKTDEAIQQFKDLTRASKEAEIVKIKTEIDSKQLDADEIGKTLAKDLQRAISAHRPWQTALEPDALAAAQFVRDQLKNALAGTRPDYDAMAAAIKNATGLSEEQRSKWLTMIATLENGGMKIRELRRRYEEFNAVANQTVDVVANVTAAMNKAGQEGAAKLIESLKDRLADLTDPSTFGKVQRELDKLTGYTDEQKQDALDYAAAIDAVAAAQKRAASARKAAKQDAYAQQTLSLTQALAQAEQRLANARAGVDEETRRASDALGVWLKTSKEAKTLTDAQAQSLRSQAQTVDAAATAYKALADAKARAARIESGVSGVEQRLFELDGNTVEAARRQFAQQYKELIADLKAEIAAGGEGAQARLDLVLKLEGWEIAKAQLDAVLADIQKVQDAQGRAEQSLQTEIDAGVLTELQGRERLLTIHKQTAAELTRIKPLLEQLAQAPDEAGERARAALEKLKTEVQQLEATLGLFEKALKDGLQSGLQEALTGLVKGTMSLKDAISALANAVLDAMLKVATQHLAEKATNGLFGLLGGGSGASGGEGSGASGALGKESEGATLSVAGAQLTAAAMTLEQAALLLTQGMGGLSAAASGLGQAGSTLSSTGGLLSSGASTLGASGTMLTTSGTLLTTSGGVLSTSGMGLGTAAGGLSTAAGGLSSAAAGLSASGGSGGGGGWGGLIASVVSLIGSMFSSGGYTGSGGKFEPAGIVHAAEFVTRREVTRQPGARAFLEDFNRTGMPALKKWGLRHLFGLPGYAGGGLVLPAPEAALDTRALTSGWRLSEARGAGTTMVENRQTFNLIDDPARVSDALKSRAGIEAITVVLSRDPAKFRAILGVR